MIWKPVDPSVDAVLAAPGPSCPSGYDAGEHQLSSGLRKVLPADHTPRPGVYAARTAYSHADFGASPEQARLISAVGVFLTLTPADGPRFSASRRLRSRPGPSVLLLRVISLVSRRSQAIEPPP